MVAPAYQSCWKELMGSGLENARCCTWQRYTVFNVLVLPNVYYRFGLRSVYTVVLVNCWVVFFCCFVFLF